MNNEEKISISTAVLMNINMMVGAGIFLNPMFMAQSAGALSFLVWPIIGVIFLPIVLSVATIATFFPGEGSFYTYSKDTLGNFAGFISGWLYFIGYVAVGVTHLIAIKRILETEAGLNFVAVHPMISSGLIISCLVLLSLFSLRIVGFIQSAATLFKIIPLIFVSLLLFFYLNSSTVGIESLSFGSILNTIPYALFGFWGFESCVSISHRIKGGKDSAAKSALIAFFVTLIIYTLFNFGLIKIMGAQNLAQYGVRSVVQFLNLSPFFTTFFNALIKTAITVAHISVCFGTFIACSYLLHSMACKKLLLGSSLLSIQSKDGQPVAALIFQSFLMFIFAMFSTNLAVVTCISVLGILAAFVITFISLLIIQIKNRMTLNIFITVCAFLTSGLIFYYTYLQIGSLVNTVPVFIIAGIGIILFLLRKLI